MMKPYLVEKMIYPDGSEKTINPEEKRQVISPEAAHKLTSMLVSTVRNGYDKIKINGYFVAGKTGTAQIPNEGSRGYSDEFIHTFVGYAPAFDPKFIILLKMDKPRGIRFASDSLSPPFANLTKYLLNYYEIPPEE
jgi:cell division protein FtsI/penicillin-binding protein 2